DATAWLLFKTDTCKHLFMLETPNPYDIDLVRLYYLAKLQVDFLNISVSEKKKYKSGLLKEIKQYCRLNIVNFKKHLFGPVPLVIRPEDHLYHKFLPYALLHIEIEKIRFFLNHHKRMHKGDYLISGNSFVDHIELKVCGEIERLSVVDTKERLLEILEWVEQKRTKKGKVKKLLWVSPEKCNLQKLSERLFYFGFTEGEQEFRQIFTENRQIRWLKSIEELAYLFYYLRSKEYIRPQNTVGYLKHLEYIFAHLEIRKVDRYGLNGVLIRMKKKNQEMKERIEDLVNSCLT
ncbi:MAG TPA: hypothetical protein VF868_15370, partial [Bacteroidia bacterium]